MRQYWWRRRQRYDTFKDADMKEFDIKFDFANFKDAWDAYEMLKNAGKYNL